VHALASASQHRHGIVVPHVERGAADPGKQRGRAASMASGYKTPGSLRLEIFLKAQRLCA
jgi:hypothetical protein